MGKRGRSRKDQTQKNPSVEGAPSQESQQQETMASLWSGRVKRMKQEPTIGTGSALDFVPSPSRPQTRTYLKAVMDNCRFKTATPRSPVRNVKASHPSSATAHLISGISKAINEKVVDSVHQSILTNHGALGGENQKQGQHTQTAPSFPEVVMENNATVNKADVVSNANVPEPQTRSGQSGACPTKSMSLNLTRVAALMNDYLSDPDEIESRPGDLSVINGYRVKQEAAPILEKIFQKHGDIARHSSFTSTICSSLLEFVCDIYKKLEETNFLSLTPKEIQSMLAEVRDLKSAAKIDVGWLSQRLNNISQANQLVHDSCKLKEAKTRNLVVMETNKKEQDELKKELAACIATCRVLQEKISKKEDEFGIARSENEKIMQQFEDSKAKVKGFLKKPLVHDLL
ncbi:uncharacterized protein LOC132055453 isoform X1 [Lycium ferocissimum]|uniref:uncharacterized protein LOC132055453 isoform X1 n=1 Tax=Lycium ferocissimum TaxID=112874 RepID=UPI0028167C75|nr:uncharacterized protein LOC132055453 isoform X1 [Lycium ferocissimum]XP_059303268.1 uncharacterized protein LOC132055453 isoform X1 [Lycium ferocissimum]XP_059303269.1 uncharacterized protein LOC132055453 isoform X1 [Lycium ferocissimum]XP_059303270.1 uncharacterized protein LOC132055453 isoform X1 [Lycium ferocissimum]XP_059303271.1 uncharacterized protein LOC132055453 isoform X1 [Lycium ferocissimum]XP_059303272.1 uncharacterized protein LOC132055453 isoform X1 [Lycium ferocissimum]XP_05